MFILLSVHSVVSFLAFRIPFLNKLELRVHWRSFSSQWHTVCILNNVDILKFITVTATFLITLAIVRLHVIKSCSCVCTLLCCHSVIWAISYQPLIIFKFMLDTVN